jgi:hypothetical protein
VVDIYSFRLVLAGSVDHCADRKSTDRSVCLGDCRVVRDTVESSMFRYVGSSKVKEFDLGTVSFFGASTSVHGFVPFVVPGHCVDHPAFAEGISYHLNCPVVPSRTNYLLGYPALFRRVYYAGECSATFGELKIGTCNLILRMGCFLTVGAVDHFLSFHSIIYVDHIPVRAARIWLLFRRQPFGLTPKRADIWCTNPCST